MKFDPHSHQIELAHQPTPEQPYPAELIGPGQWANFLYHRMTAPSGAVEFRLIRNHVIRKEWMEFPVFEGHPEFRHFEDVATWQKQGHDAFFGVSLRKKAGVSGDAQVHPTHLIWADLDMKGTAYIPDGANVLKMSSEALREAAMRLYADLMARCAAQGLQPLAVNYSGHGLQIHFARSASSTTADTVRMNLALFELFQDLGADRKVKNPERILRVPGGYNLKNPERPIQIEVWHIDADARVQDQVVEALISELEPRPAAPIAKRTSKAAPVSSDKAKARAEKRRRAEVTVAVNGEAENVRSATDGERNHTLNIATVKLARFLPHGELEEGELIETLTAVALAAGLDAEETAATIRSGIAFGTQDPADPQRFDEEEAQRPKKVQTERISAAVDQPSAVYQLPTFPKGTQEGTDAANAHILAMNGLSCRLRYTVGAGWFVYHQASGVWRRDPEQIYAAQEAGAVLREVVGQYLADAFKQRIDEEERKRIARWASVVCGNYAVDGALKAAAGRPEFLTDVSAWDADPFLMNCRNGVLDLKARTLRPHAPDDLMTWQSGAAFNPAATHLNVDKLLELLREDGRHDFVQRSVGSVLCGIAPNETLTVLQGEGQTGKGTAVSAVTGMMGDYAATVEVKELLTSAHGERAGGPSPELLELRGKRLVIAGEPPKGARFNAGRVKGMTGNDPITARAMRSNTMVTFTPVFKLWIHTNYPIGSAHDDSGMARRVRVIPFTAKPTRADPKFKHVLQHDPMARSALLNWALEGFSMWYASGYDLGESEAVSNATGGYWADQNPYQKFAVERLIFSPTSEISSGQLKSVFEGWAEDNGYKIGRAVKIADLHAYLRAKGCRPEHTRQGNVWVGAELTVNAVNPVKVQPHISPATTNANSVNGGLAFTAFTAFTDDVSPSRPDGWEEDSLNPLAPSSGEL